MDVNRIEELIKVLEGSRTEELSVRRGDVSVRIRKGGGHGPSVGTAKKRTQQKVGSNPAQPEQVPAEHLILAPMVGIFHTVDGIAKIGSRITAGQVVGVIESMKLLNDVVASASGVVVETMVEDGTPVEFGQPLCRVEPAELG